MAKIEQAPQGAMVNPQTVIQVLSNRITGLTVENAMLQARVMELEGQLQAKSGPKAVPAPTSKSVPVPDVSPADEN